ncbi:MAG: hypothetical protein ACOX4M_10850 [Acetivibrionales bacterium]|jgi:hypothetical protein
MMENNDIFRKIFDYYKNGGYPTEQQKNRMLIQILGKAHSDNTMHRGFLHFVSTYPWRFAFGVSLIQTVLATLILGREYTNLLLVIIGGNL